MKIPCALCGGEGKHFAYPASQLCPICDGEGQFDVLGAPELANCVVCKGTGRHFTYPNSQVCPKCDGMGRRTRDGFPPVIVGRNEALPERPTEPLGGWFFVNGGRLDQLRALHHNQYDLQKLVRLCEELNAVYGQGCFLATIMLTRSLLDHVPPIFGKATFLEVANNYGSRSFKDAMQQLDQAARKIADGHLHGPIRRSEILPNAQQVNFGPQIDLLLAEIVRIVRA